MSTSELRQPHWRTRRRGPKLLYQPKETLPLIHIRSGGNLGRGEVAFSEKKCTTSIAKRGKVRGDGKTRVRRDGWVETKILEERAPSGGGEAKILPRSGGSLAWERQ